MMMLARRSPPLFQKMMYMIRTIEISLDSLIFVYNSQVGYTVADIIFSITKNRIVFCAITIAIETKDCLH